MKNLLKNVPREVYVNFRCYSLILVLLVLTACTSRRETSRSSLELDLLSGTGQIIENYSDLTIKQGLNYYLYSQDTFVEWRGQSKARQLIALGMDEETVTINLNENRDGEWRVEQLRYPKQKTIKDYIAIRLEGFVQIAEIELSVEEEVTLKSLKFLTWDESNKSHPNLSSDKEILLFCNYEENNKLEFYHLRNGERETLFENAFYPIWFEDKEEFLFIDESVSQRAFLIGNLKGESRLANEDELKKIIKLSKTKSARAFYAMKLLDMTESQELTVFTSLDEFLKNVSLKSDEVKAARHAVMASLGSYLQERYNKGPDLVLGGAYTVDNNILTNESDESAGDTTSLNDFLRVTTGLSYPIIANNQYRESFKDFKNFQYEEEIQKFYEVVNKVINESLKQLHTLYANQQKAKLYLELMSLCESNIDKYKAFEAENLRAREKLKFYNEQKAFFERQALLNELELEAARETLSSRLGGGASDKLNFTKISHLYFQDEFPEIENLIQRSYLNNPHLRQLHFKILQAAAEKDMGHPLYRKDYLNLQANYGLGLHHWDKFIDDFISVSVSAVRPLRSSELKLAYHKEWVNRIKSLRYELKSLRKKLEIEARESYGAIGGFNGYYEQYQKNVLSLYENVRRQIAIVKLAYVQEEKNLTIEEAYLEYLKGMLGKVDLRSEAVLTHLSLLETLNDYQLYFRWFSGVNETQVSTYNCAQFESVLEDLKATKKCIALSKHHDQFYLHFEKGFSVKNDLELQFIYKKIKERGGDLVPVFLINGNVRSHLSELKKFEDLAKIKFQKLAFGLKNDKELPRISKMLTEALTEDIEVDFLIDEKVNELSVNQEIQHNFEFYNYKKLDKVDADDVFNYFTLSQIPVTYTVENPIEREQDEVKNR